jgi:TetR/AcrR family transcriptional repressor of nem operon
MASADAGSQVVRAYLSRQHFEDVENSCPMIALPSDVTRSGKNAKRAFEKVFEAMIGVLERNLTDSRSPRHTRAQAIAALCVGGMVVARAMVNRNAADELRDACMAIALELGGWEDQRPLKNGVRKGPRRSGAAIPPRTPSRAI